MFYDHYPYTNFHNVNLDWVLQAVKAWGATVEANDRAFRDLQEANDDFKAYVTHYLQDLDVSDEINAKLDAMLAAGTLTPYFRPYIASEVSSWLTGHITPTTPALDNTLKVVNAAAESSHTGEALNDLAYTALRGEFRELKAIVPGSIAPGYRIQSIVRNYTNGKYYLVGGSNAHDGTGVIIVADGPDLSGAVVTVVDQLGHANDVTYYEGFLYVCTAGNNGAAEGNAPLNKVWKIDVSDFTSKTLVEGTPDGIYGITYDYGRFYMLANNKIYYSNETFDSLTVAVDNIYSFTTPGAFPASGRLIQGLFTYPNHVIGLVSDYVVEGTHNGAITFFTRRGLMIAAKTFESVNAEVQGACTGTDGNIIVVTSNETELSTVLIQRLFDRDYEIIPNYADLDDYRATGTYYCNVRETAGSLTHCPTTEAFTMRVARLGMLHVSQEITDQTARVYIRTGNGRTGAWGEWTDEAAEISQVRDDITSLQYGLSVLTPDVYVTRRAFMQDVSAEESAWSITIKNGFIHFVVTNSTNRGFIISKTDSGLPVSVANIDNYIPDIGNLSDISLINGCNTIRMVTKQITTAVSRKSFLLLEFFNLLDGVATKLTRHAISPATNGGYSTYAFKIPETATHYVLYAYLRDMTPSTTTTDAVIQFTREISASALTLTNREISANE